MKIDNSLTTPALSAGSRPKPVKDAGSAASAAPADEVKLSGLAGLQAGESEAPFDSSRIAEIKAAISEGRFEINAGAIADRLLDTARDLVGRQPRA